MDRLHDQALHARLRQDQRETLEAIAADRGQTVSEVLRDGLNCSPFFSAGIGRFLLAIAEQEGIPPRRIVERATLWLLSERQAELRAGRSASRLPALFTIDKPLDDIFEVMTAAHLQAKQEEPAS